MPDTRPIEPDVALAKQTVERAKLTLLLFECYECYAFFENNVGYLDDEELLDAEQVHDVLKTLERLHGRHVH